MSDPNKSDFKEIVRKIEKNQILLPDFQREFVWTAEERQKKIVSSVLAKMPVGSILLLASKPDEYSSKNVGLRTTLDTSKMSGDEVFFLLDGQQRITVLSNVFSSIIHDKCTSNSDYVSPVGLKRRFFLCVPKWKDLLDSSGEDCFGVKQLNFPMKNPDFDDPTFLSGNIYDNIIVLGFGINDDKVYNPKTALSAKLITFCTSYEKGYLVPLYLMIPPLDARQGTAVYLYKQIIENIAKCIAEEITTEYKKIIWIDEKKDFIKSVINDKETADAIISLPDSEIDAAFAGRLDMNKAFWAEQFKSYLDSCITNLNLFQIHVKSSQRGRAIDIYENLNMGGVSLSTFDLIMAKVAKVDNNPFYKRIVKEMLAEKKYPTSVIPPHIYQILKDDLENKTYNATDRTGCYNEGKNELNPKYVDIFLDVLGMSCYNPSFEIDEFRIEYMKKDKILQLKPEQIHGGCEKVIQAIDKALFFLQTRCGVRSIQGINNTLMVVIIALVFLDDAYFYNPETHKLLEAWYWAALFSGEFDKDQNDNCIKNLRNIFRTLKESKSVEWIRGDSGLYGNVLKAQNFSDEGLLLMEKVDDDHIPKQVIRSFFCDYMLSRTYPDMFDGSITISAFYNKIYDDSTPLQAHHIIPLGSVKKIGDMNTGRIRKDEKNICNSPLNFVLITSASNRKISDYSLDDYVQHMNPTAKSKLWISAYSSVQSADTNKKLHDILKQRYDNLQGDIAGHIKDLLLNWA